MDSVHFLSDSLTIDKSIQIKPASYYTAELGYVNLDANSKSTTTTYVGAGIGSVGVRKTSGGISITGLIIKDK